MDTAPVDRLKLVTPYPHGLATDTTLHLHEITAGKPCVLHLFTGWGGCWPCASQMDAWAGGKYFGKASFVCVGCDGPQLASTFAKQLRLAKCTLTYAVDNPKWGQLGCNGFIVLDGNGKVACRASMAYLDVRERAFQHVESLLDGLLDGAPAPAVSIGQSVVLHGLSRAELNGQVGVLVSGVDAATGRCSVQLHASGKVLAVKPANVQIGRGGEAVDDEEDDEEAFDDSGSWHTEKGCGSQKKPRSEKCNKAAEVEPLAPIHSVSVAALDEEHEACASALGQLAAERSLNALAQVLRAYEAHFAHEEQLLDEYVWKDAAAAAAAGGGAVDGFDRKASMRKTHLADHARMITELAPGYAKLAKGGGGSISRDAAVLPQSVVDKALRDFEMHANQYDSYGEELAAALEKAKVPPPAAVAVA